MALEKDIEQPTGITTSYWFIDDLRISKLRGEAIVEVVGYASEAVRHENPVSGIAGKETIRIEGDDFAELYEQVVVGDRNLYVTAYEYLMGTKGSVLYAADPIFDDVNQNQ